MQDYSELALDVIRTYREEFPDAIIGYSGHETGIVMPVVAYVLGARVVEKHFTLNRASKGTDHGFSLEPPGLARVARDLERVHLALSSCEKKFYPSEREARRKMGKSITVNEDLLAGTRAHGRPGHVQEPRRRHPAVRTRARPRAHPYSRSS